MNAAVRLPDPFGADDVDEPRRDPFQARYDDASYLDEAVRAKRLNLLFHLIPYSDVLLVTGEPGSGKSTVLHRLLAGAGGSWRVCTLQAAAEIDGARLLDLLQKEFQLRPDERADLDQRLRLMRESLYALRHSALVPVLLIDDAHLLTQSALIMLAALTEPWESKEKLLGVVMFGEPEINKRLIAPGLETLRARVSHTFDIPPLSEQDTGRYIRHRLQAAGMSGAGPFTESVIKFIHVASRGFPGRINEFARVVLHNSEQKVTRPALTATLGSRTKVYFKYGVAALLASSAAVGLLYQDRLLELVGRGQRATVGPAAEAPPAAAAPAGGQVPSSPETAVAESMPPADIGASLVDASQSPVQAEPAVPEETAVSVAEAPASPAATEEAEATPPVEPIGVAEEPAVVAAPQASPTEPPETAAAATGMAPSPATTSPAALRDDNWLLAQDPGAYTLQLLVASHAQCLAYIARHGLGDAAALYQTRSSGQVWTSLVYGIYATDVDAADAAKAITEQDVNAKPWVRKVALVQTRIREFRGDATPPAPGLDAGNNKGMPGSGDIRREPWLLGQSPEAYTLQLFSGKEANVMAYIKRHALSSQVALYQPPDGVGRLTVTYGVYPTRADAVQAGKDLELKLPDVKPWPRALREIQAVISPAQGAVTPAPAPFPPQANQ